MIHSPFGQSKKLLTEESAGFLIPPRLWNRTQRDSRWNRIKAQAFLGHTLHKVWTGMRHDTPRFHKMMEGRPVYRDLSAASIRKNLEEQLRRLQTDYIDIYYTHRQTPDFSIYPLEETVEILTQLKKERKDPRHRCFQCNT